LDRVRSVAAPVKVPERPPLVAALGRTVKVIAPSAALALVNELLLVLVGILVPGSATAPFALDLGSRLSWSVLVCGGLGFGIAVARGRIGMAGAIGFVSAPIAFDVARAVRKGTVSFLQLVDTSGAPSPLLVGGIKGIEFACLSVALSYVARKRGWRATGHGVIGLTTGVIFGAALLGLGFQAGAVGLGAVLTWAVNEVLYPMGCALVIYHSDVARPAGSRLR
jgi:hypothetical protein